MKRWFFNTLKNKVDVGSLKELLETNPVALIENKELDKILNFVFLAKLSSKSFYYYI